MPFALLDVIFLIVILIFALIATAKGFIGAIFGKLCWIMGLFGAFFFYKYLLKYMTGVIKNEMLAAIACFFLIFVVIFLIVKIIQVILQKAFSGDIMKGLDRALGFFFGLVEGLVIVFIFIFIVKNQPWFDVRNLFEGSLFYQILSPMLDFSHKAISNAQGIA